MPRLLLKLALVSTLLFTILCLAFRIPRSIQPSNPVLNGFTEGCDDKSPPCWYGITPGITKFDEVPQILKSMADWKDSVIEQGHSTRVEAIWSITNPNFTDCTVIVNEDPKSIGLVLNIGFARCLNILFADLADFIEYPGTIRPGCNPLDGIYYRSIGIVTNDNLAFFSNNSVGSFTLYHQTGKSDWMKLLNNLVEDDDGGIYVRNKEFHYAKIAVIEDGCG